MPLIQSSKPKAFVSNLKTEMHAGKPQNQSLAIAYSVKRKNEHKKHMAHGGLAEGRESFHEEEGPSGFLPDPTEHEIHNEAAIEEDDMGFNQKMHHGGKVHHMAEGGCPSCGYAEGGDVVDRIMHKKHMSEGGRVANEDHEHADDESAQFDDLVKDDHLEFHEDGANSGDELGDAQEDHDRADIISRILKSYNKKDKMPRPA